MAKQIFYFLAALVILVSCNTKKAEEKITETDSQNAVGDNEFSESTLAVMNLVTEASELFKKMAKKHLTPSGFQAAGGVKGNNMFLLLVIMVLWKYMLTAHWKERIKWALQI